MDRVFVPGLRLAGEFYAEVVRPLLDREFPGLRYAAALLGPGSEVLGLDTARSADHDWGPRLQVFLLDADSGSRAGAVDAMLAGRLPAEFGGWPVAFEVTREPGRPGRHRVEVTGLGSWLRGQLGFDPRAGVTVRDWLSAPWQRLAELTGGAVFHDEFGELTSVRAALAWYPHDLWLYVLRCQWQRIGQEEAFPGRCAEVGDELGSVVVTARLVRDIMRLWLLMHRRYPPYSKWLGSAFGGAPGTETLRVHLSGALAATDWAERERHLVTAYETVAAAHNELGLTGVIDPSVRFYYDRPFRVLECGRFSEALSRAIADPVIRRLPPADTADQALDSTDAPGDLRFPRAVVDTYGLP
jgi:Domain of unknown function (DUF4037)